MLMPQIKRKSKFDYNSRQVHTNEREPTRESEMLTMIRFYSIAL